MDFIAWTAGNGQELPIAALNCKVRNAAVRSRQIALPLVTHSRLTLESICGIVLQTAPD